MTHSMTGFSRQQVSADWGSVTWEIRSVNHRHLETSVRFTEIVIGLENTVREALREEQNGGKVDDKVRVPIDENQKS